MLSGQQPQERVCYVCSRRSKWWWWWWWWCNVSQRTTNSIHQFHPSQFILTLMCLAWVLPTTLQNCLSLSCHICEDLLDSQMHMWDRDHEDKQPTSPRFPCKSICETTLLEKLPAERYWHLIYPARGKLNRHVCDANLMLVNVREIYDSSNYISLYIPIMYSCLRLNFLCKLEAVKGMNGP